MIRTALLVAGAALLAVLFWRLGPLEITRALARIGWYFVPVVLLGAAHQIARALALYASILRPGALRYRDALAIRFSGEAVRSLTFTGPALSEPTKAWLLEERGLSLREAFAATLTEYLVDAFVTAGIAATGVIFLLTRFHAEGAVRVVAIVAACLLVTFLAVSGAAIGRRFYLIGTVVAWLARIGVLRGRLTPDMNAVNRMEDLLLIVFRDRPRRFAAIAAIDAMAQLLYAFELFWLLRGIGIEAPLSVIYAIDASVKFFEFAFAVVPLQLGVSEGTYASMFAVAGLSSAGGVAAAILRRSRTLVIAGIGLAMITVMTRRRAARSSGPNTV
jgi:uncharacterized protein (TIRG00374 family)